MTPMDGSSCDFNTDDMNADMSQMPMDGGAQMPQGEDMEMPDDMEDNEMGQNMGGNPETQEIDDLWNSLDTESRSALLKYGKSMKDDDDDSEEEAEQGQMPTMAECVMFSKSQLKKIQENINRKK